MMMDKPLSDEVLRKWRTREVWKHGFFGSSKTTKLLNEVSRLRAENADLRAELTSENVQSDGLKDV